MNLINSSGNVGKRSKIKVYRVTAVKIFLEISLRYGSKILNLDSEILPVKKEKRQGCWNMRWVICQ